jgi:hypothetical protein
LNEVLGNISLPTCSYRFAVLLDALLERCSVDNGCMCRQLDCVRGAKLAMATSRIAREVW